MTFLCSPSENSLAFLNTIQIQISTQSNLSTDSLFNDFCLLSRLHVHCILAQLVFLSEIREPRRESGFRV